MPSSGTRNNTRRNSTARNSTARNSTARNSARNSIAGNTVRHRGVSYVVGAYHRLIRFPNSVRTPKQRLLWLLKQGQMWTAYMYAKHANKILIALLKRTHPDYPWKNLEFAARHA